MRIAAIVSRAMTLFPMAACSATSNICRGISFRNRSIKDLPRSNAKSRWTMIDKASTGSPATRTSSFDIGETRVPDK